MTSTKVTVGAKHGVHMRVAGVIVQAASRFKSEIFISKGGIKANGKSILGVISLTIRHGEEVIVEAEGADEKDAIAEIGPLFEQDLDVTSTVG